MADKSVRVFSQGDHADVKLVDIGAGTYAVAVTGAAGGNAGALEASEAHIGQVSGNLVTIAREFTRPANTTAYTAGDAVGDSTSALTMQELANAARVSGGSGYIVGVRLATDKKSITPRIRVHFFSANGATLANDNEAWKDLYADSSKRVGYVDLPAMTTGTDTTNSDMSRSLDLTVRVPYVCNATSLYYVLEALDAFTPASGQKFNLTVTCDRN